MEAADPLTAVGPMDGVFVVKCSHLLLSDNDDLPGAPPVLSRCTRSVQTVISAKQQ